MRRSQSATERGR